MKKVKNKTVIISLISICIVLSIVTFTYSKYISNHVWDYYFKIQEFYFSSDYLDSNMVNNIDNMWNGEDIYFNVRNNLNEKVITKYDIDYYVSCSIEGEAKEHLSCNINDKGTDVEYGVLSSYQTCVNNEEDGVDVSSYNKTTCEINGYEWMDQIAENNFYFNLTKLNPDYEIKDVIVNIVVNSTYPYAKTLSGRFVLHKIELKDDIIYEYKKFSNYSRLIVSNSSDNNKCISIGWDSDKLLVDDYLNDIEYKENANGYVDEIIVNLMKKSNMSFIFYDRSDIEYNKDGFNIQNSNECE